MLKAFGWFVILVATAVLVAFGVRHIDTRVADGRKPVPVGELSRGLGPVPNPSGALVDIDVATLSSGPVPAQIGEHDFATVNSGRNSTAIAVTDGKLTHGRPLVGDAAGYVETGLRRPVVRVGATVSFADQSADIALVVWQESLAQARSQGRTASAGIHFVASAVQWHLGVWDSSTMREIVLMAEPYTAAGPPGTRQSFEITRDGDTANVHLPDGSVRTVSDPRIAAWSGTAACWELYEFQPTDVPATVTRFWAG